MSNKNIMGNKERFKVIPVAYLILVRDKQILLSRRFQTGYEDGKYSLVAGHADGNETMREVMAREVGEEIGVKIDPVDLQHCLIMHRQCGDHERIGFYFTAEKWDGKVINMEPNKCDDLSWFHLDQLPENTIPYIRFAIDCYLRGEKYCEFGWDGQ